MLEETLPRLGQRVLALGEEIDQLPAENPRIVHARTSGLVATEPDLGSLGPAQLLLPCWHAGRVHTDTGFTMLAGAASNRPRPNVASRISGNTIRTRCARPARTVSTTSESHDSRESTATATP